MTTAASGEGHVHNPVLSGDVYPGEDLVEELTDSLRPRLVPAAPSGELEHLVRSTLKELAPVHITNYLGVLVERRLRVGGHATTRLD